MRRLAFLSVGLLLSTAVFAGTSTYVDVGYITGGENGENGGPRQDCLEVAGSFAVNNLWYVGGVLGSYDRRELATNDYLNVNTGTVRGLTKQTDLIVEFGLWAGRQDPETGSNTDPRSVEVKFGLNSRIGEKFSGFGTISLVAGDLDTPGSSNLQNFVWSAGGAYSFTKIFSVSLKVVKGSNGVNGQSDVARLGARWTF